MIKVDLNCDLGESFGSYKVGLDDKVIPFISSANVACGWHASDPTVMSKTIALAKEANISVGAHPGFLDLMGFGRRNMEISKAEARNYVTYQIGALDAFCKLHQVTMQHVKPHGALYNMAGKDIELARGICEAIYNYNPNLIMLALAGSKMIDAANEIGLKVAREVFADRAYEDDGSLVARTKEGAVITDKEIAIGRVVRMVKEGKVTSINENDIEIKVDSICVHGDNESALIFVENIRKALESEGVLIAPLNEVI